MYMNTLILPDQTHINFTEDHNKFIKLKMDKKE